MRIFLNAFILLFILTGLSGCKTLPVPQDGVEVEFPYVNGKNSDKRFIIPAHMKPPYLYPLSYVSEKNTSKKLEEVKKDGVTIYCAGTSMYPFKFVSKNKFNKIKPDLTLRQILKILGPGYMSAFSGIYAIRWTCKDGGELLVWSKCKLDEKPKCSISAKNKNHEIIKKMAENLISGIKIFDKKVLLVCIKDTAQATAGEARFYKINDWISKRNRLPSVEFKIIQIEPDGIFCEYFYQALPKENMRYSETGLIFIKPKRSKR